MSHFGLFEVWGIEIEYMIVDAETLDVRPIADELLRDAAGGDEWVEDVEDGEVGWSNELVCHVVEMKNAQPVPRLDGLADRFAASAARMQERLSRHGARLMPGGMHPWMDPAKETRLWPHETGPIYRAYDRMFDCRRHGWANLQSVHLNLPFRDEREFGRLMAAVRLVLPLVPALAASSPIVERADTGRLDSRLAFYRTNSSRVPAMAGDVIPEPVFGIDEYRTKVLQPISAALRESGAPPELLAGDWLNARGAIARFDRMAIEIRLIDAQECARADLAVAAAVAGAVRFLVEERGSPLARQQAFSGESLGRLLRRTIRRGPQAHLMGGEYVRLFGLDPRRVATAGQLWQELAPRVFAGPAELEAPLGVVLRDGTLAERILQALGSGFDDDDLRRVWRRLCACLAEGRSFAP